MARWFDEAERALHASGRMAARAQTYGSGLGHANLAFVTLRFGVRPHAMSISQRQLGHRQQRTRWCSDNRERIAYTGHRYAGTAELLRAQEVRSRRHQPKGHAGADEAAGAMAAGAAARTASNARGRGCRGGANRGSRCGEGQREVPTDPVLLGRHPCGTWRFGSRDQSCHWRRQDALAGGGKRRGRGEGMHGLRARS